MGDVPTGQRDDVLTEISQFVLLLMQNGTTTWALYGLPTSYAAEIGNATPVQQGAALPEATYEPGGWSPQQ